MITVGSRTATLSCAPGWSDPACTALERAGGDPGRLQRREGASCTMEYSPVHATATGVWDGREYQYERTFSNACELAVTTGPVFQI
ncbi:SSI family serine proteinase inhibitor [Nonomuraea rhizosphaerae]|uniref:SSI family serine proteinase inhibitor n=1 Tax=Nonomuraea rhizosphaerae TaxID=2665663 RepID=UPI001C5CED93|nr:SSI family serine proteinase inhibitor [Nonomuraea rhizosphaerae]